MRRRVRIDRLVIADGVIGERDVEALRRALQAELGQRLGGAPSDRSAGGQQRTIPSLAAAISVPRGDASGLARSIGATIHGALQ